MTTWTSSKWEQSKNNKHHEHRLLKHRLAKFKKHPLNSSRRLLWTDDIWVNWTGKNKTGPRKFSMKSAKAIFQFIRGYWGVPICKRENQKKNKRNSRYLLHPKLQTWVYKRWMKNGKSHSMWVRFFNLQVLYAPESRRKKGELDIYRIA